MNKHWLFVTSGKADSLSESVVCVWVLPIVWCQCHAWTVGKSNGRAPLFHTDAMEHDQDMAVKASAKGAGASKASACDLSI